MTDTAEQPTDDDLADRLGSLDELAREGLLNLHDHLDEVDDFLSWLREEIPSEGDGIVADIQDLVEAVDEFEDVVAELDPEALAEAIDVDEIDAEDVRAVMDSDGELNLRDLLEILDLEGLWHATDVRDLWTEIREFRDEADDVDLGSDDGDDDEGGLDVPDVDTDDVGMDDVPTDVADDLSEKRIQSTVMDGVEEFRSSVLAARAELKEVVEENRERAEDRSREVHSRNPTAVSTLPRSRSTTRSVGRFSTVPRETRYSSAENKRRLYGRRLERETEEVAEDA